MTNKETISENTNKPANQTAKKRKRDFRDVLYNKIDLAVALIILLLASFVIFWRFSAVMNYTPDEVEPQIGSSLEDPDNLDEDNNNATTDTDTNLDKDKEPDKEPNKEPDKEPNKEPDKNDDNNPPAKVEPTKATWDNGVLTKSIKVTLQGGTATAAVNSMISAGLISSYEAYEDKCNTLERDPLSIMAMTFTFAKGLTIDDIILKVTQD